MPMLSNIPARQGIASLPAVIRDAGNKYRNKYPYANSLDLNPDSRLHNQLVAEVLTRAYASRDYMTPRYDVWRENIEQCQAYIPLDDEEELLQSKDVRKPVSIVIPVMYAIKDTMLTYLSAVFFQEPTFRYKPMSSEDTVGVALLERLVEVQVARSKARLALHTAWNDAILTGIGASMISWHTEFTPILEEPKSFVPVVEGLQDLLDLDVDAILAEPEISTEPDILYEGGRIQAIDPFKLLPDPDSTIDNPQEAEFIGFIRRTNRNSIITQALATNSDIINYDYLREANDWRSCLTQSEDSERDLTGGSIAQTGLTAPVDVIYMYINLVPSEWNIGSSNYPQKWLFGIAGDQLLIYAKPLGLRHNRYPLALGGPEYDGYTFSPLSKLELIKGIQITANWMHNAHVMNARKSVNDMLVVDPLAVNMNDALKPGPGKIIRLRPGATVGRNIDQCIKQLAISDVTRNNMSDVQSLLQMAQQAIGSNDNIQGMPLRQGERVTAQEITSTRSSAMARMERMARIIGMMYHYDAAYLMAAHTIELMSQQQSVEIFGNYEQELREQFPDNKFVSVAAGDIDVNFDVVISDGTIPGTADMQALSQMFQTAATNEILLQNFDIVKMYVELSRLGGVRNVREYMLQGGGNIQTQMLPQDQIQSQLDKGNIRAIGGK